MNPRPPWNQHRFPKRQRSTASPLPPAPQEVDAEVTDDEVVMTFGDRRYRVRGWQRNLSFDQLRVNVMASNERGMFVDTFDIYAAKYRKTFIAQTAADLVVEENTIKKDLGRVLAQAGRTARQPHRGPDDAEGHHAR